MQFTLLHPRFIFICFRGKNPAKSSHRTRLEHIPSTDAAPPKNSDKSWIRYQPDEQSHPAIGKDSLREKPLAQTILPINEISGRDNRYSSLQAQDLEEISR